MPFFDRSQDRRQGLRKAVNLRGLIVAPGLELRCVIVDLSEGGMKVRLDRGMALPAEMTIVDLAAGTAQAATLAWSKGQEAGLRMSGPATALGGLVSTRFAPARDAWRRAGGR
ncbi:PilZ domain-containing protein [Brevundimonas sp. S30B]|uniref:PilZ domain-containing protein n=1 Tax=unclassified Brevundimonas TaxID=2622653 RepID=UPI00107180A1|nr:MULTISPECIES: PilZ domain-containing protein [unclassified Brevundimonas]QBX37075.1 PilZ domain-containing protein [Brevundimonas sp. MF30-B]TFW04129.1 PilZ domain-containing protein [Brevundimonas sp. S30B]